MENPRYDVFLSHATLDKPVVEELARRLKKAGFEPWLDKWNLIPGDPWQEAIEQALEECAACAVCLGPSGTGPWQNEEMRAAIDRRVADRSRTFRVIPVLLPHSERGEPSRLPAFLRATTWVEFRETLDDEKALHRLVCGIRGVPPGADPGEAVAEGACPYRGLQVFDVGDALFFFGREALTEWLLDKLRTDRTGNRFLAIVGPSGSGKSSLARAGLVASLKQGKIPGSDTWPAVICKPGAQPLESLAIALAGAARLGDSPSAVLNLIRDLGANPSLLHLTTRLSLREAPADRRLVVLVDQFEEVFTLCPDEAQRQAIIANLLYAATAADGQTVVVLTLRADFYGRCAAYPDLATAVSDRQSPVVPMSRDDLRNAIERPAYLAGCELEGGLTDLLLNELESQPGSLPLLEHALLQIWQRREGGRRLTIAAYREVGGVAGALEKHAEEVYSGFTDEEKEACRQIFLRLVQVDEQGRATKRRLGLEELPGEGVVSRLTNARLLTTDQEQRPTVELAHEALLANWERLKKWIGDDRDALRTRRRLDEAVAEWIGRDRDSSFLLEGGRLAQAEEWATGHPGEMGQEARAFLSASVADRDRERRRELDQARRQRQWAIAASVVAAFAILAALTAFYLRHVAEQQRRIALAGELSERSRTAFISDPQLGLLLAAQAMKIAQDAGEPYLPNAQSALRWALAKSGGTPLPSGPVTSLFMKQDRQLLATVGEDLHIHLWDLSAEKPPFSNRDLGEIPRDGDLGLPGSLAGNWLLVAGLKGSRLINVKSPNAKIADATLLEGEDWPSTSDPLSADGRWLATRKNGGLLLRDLNAIGSPPTSILQNRDVRTFAFSSDSLVLAAASGQGSVELWDLKTSPRMMTSVEAPEPPDQLAFGQNSQAFMIGGVPPSTEVWPVFSNGSLGKKVHLDECMVVGKALPLADGILLPCRSALEKGEIWHIKFPGEQAKENISVPLLATVIDFSPDGRWYVSGDLQGNVNLERTTKRLGQTLRLEAFEEPMPGTVLVGTVPHAIPLKLAAFSASGRWLLTQGGSEALRLWDLRRLPSITDFEPKIFQFSDISTRTITSKGEILRKDPASNQLRLWKPTGEPTSQGFPGSNKELVNHAMSADGQWIAAVTVGEALLLWRIRPDGGVAQPILLSGGVRSGTLGFSPGGRWFAAVHYTSTGESLLWDLRNPKAPPHSLTNLPSGAALAFAPGDDLVATGEPTGKIHLRVLGKDGPKIADSPNPPNVSIAPDALAFSPDGKWLAVGGEGNGVQVWRNSGSDIFLEERSGEVRSLAFSPDGHWLAAGGRDGIVQLWRWEGARTNPTPILLAGDTGAVIHAVAFTPQGLMTADSASTVRLWEMRTDKLIQLACQSAGRRLSKMEWHTYLPSEPYRKNESCPGPPNASD